MTVHFSALPDDTVLVATISHLVHVAADGNRVLRQTPLKFWPYANTGYDKRNGRFLVADYRQFRAFDAASGATVMEVNAPSLDPQRSGSVATSSDGRIASAQGTLFDVGANIELEKPRGAAKAVFIEPQQRWWVQWEKQPSGDTALTLVRAKQENLPLEDLKGSKPLFALSSGGELLVATHEPRSATDASIRDRLSAFDPNTGKRLATVTDVCLHDVCCEGTLVTAKTTNGAAVLDPKSLQVLGEWNGATRVAVSDDRKTAWILYWDIPAARLTIARETFDR